MAPTTAVSPSASSSSEKDSAATSTSPAQEVSSGSYVEDSADSKLPDTSKTTPQPKTLQSAAKPQPSASGATRQSGMKRHAGRESELVNEWKKAKKNGYNDGDGEAKPKLFQRVWSNEEEIALINAMTDYTRVKLEDPEKHCNAFFEFLRDKPLGNSRFSKVQVKDKVHRMKKKYFNILNDRFKSPGTHDLLAFQLMKNVWGDAQHSEQPKSNGKGLSDHKFLSNDSYSILFDKGFEALGFPETIMKQGLELTGEKKCAELKERWNKLHFAELGLYVERIAIMRDQAKLILDAVKSSDRVEAQFIRKNLL